MSPLFKCWWLLVGVAAVTIRLQMKGVVVVVPAD